MPLACFDPRVLNPLSPTRTKEKSTALLSSFLLVGDKGPDWNTKAQLQALRHLAATLPSLDAAPIEREATPVPRTAKQLRGEQLQDLVAAYEAGSTIRAVAKQFGVTAQTASGLLRRQGVVLRDPRLSEEGIDTAVHLYAQGLSLARVDDRVNSTAETVRRQLRKRGVKMRDTQGQ